MRSRQILLFLATITACAGDEGPTGPSITVRALAPGALAEGEAIVNIHWFPRSGNSVVALHLNGVPAVWGDAASTISGDQETIVPGAAIVTGLDQQVPAFALATGSTRIELVATDGSIVASETVDLQDDRVYSLVGYGEPTAPQHLYFDDPIPVGLDGFVDTSEPHTIRIYNLMPGGRPIYASERNVYSGTPGGDYARIVEALPYGELWEGEIAWRSYLMFDDAEQPAAPTGGVAFAPGLNDRVYVAGEVDG